MFGLYNAGGKAVTNEVQRNEESALTDLLCCPFCGGEADVESENFGDCAAPVFRVVCAHHKLDYWSDTAKEAVEFWNARQHNAGVQRE